MAMVQQEPIVIRPTLDRGATDLLFRNARTHAAWQDHPVPDELLEELYELAKWGPTAANTSPLRILFLRTPEAKERLLPALHEMNVEKVRTAPVTAVFAYDTEFPDQMPKLMPYRDTSAMFGAMPPEARERMARDNSTLQAAYTIMAARAVGLDCGPMGGFDAEAVNAEFFPDGRWRVNLICNLGYGDHEKLWPRLPRLEFNEACVMM